MEKKEIIKALKEFSEKDTIDLSAQLLFKSEYEIINEYIKNLSARIKPESAATELLNTLLGDITETNVTKEVNLENSFIDFVIREPGNTNPVCIELKPLFRISRTRNLLYKEKLNYLSYKEQIQKYLRKKGVEYVILTNIEDVYIFNRNAIIDFKPFNVDSEENKKPAKLTEIFEAYLNNRSFWDTIRKYEDDIQLGDLDIEFFEDLKKWYSHFDYINFLDDCNFSKEELVVLFINKFIFIKTLEDFGLIPYRFVQDEYERYVLKWKAKGYAVVFRQFFREIENFFEMYYNTELFNSNFFDYIDLDKKNIQIFKETFERILGLDAWSLAFGKGLVHYNYRQINEDIFGKAYETWIAENRKDEGIFYTPSKITSYMAEKLVDYLFDEPISALLEELKKPKQDENKVDFLINKITNIRIIDSSSGSGSYLIKVLKVVYEKYKKLDKETKWASKFASSSLYNVPENVKFVVKFRERLLFSESNELSLISSIILNHLFAADKDERAIDIAKTNIWKEAVKLNPQDYSFRLLDSDKMHILPNLELNFIKGDSLTDFEFENQVDILVKEFKNELTKLFEIRKEYIKDPYAPEIIEEAVNIKERIRKRLLEDTQFKHSLFFPLEFFFCFFKDDATPLPKDQWGFDGVISNPPWEELYPVKKEFAFQNKIIASDLTGKYKLNMKKFEAQFNIALQNSEENSRLWEEYQDYYKAMSILISQKYKYSVMKPPSSLAMRTHLNLFKVFMERNISIIKSNGFFANLVPSSFQTDEGGYGLRRMLIYENTLKELVSFENRGYFDIEMQKNRKLFPEVDSRFKFSIVIAHKKKSDKYNFKSKFYLRDPDDLNNDNFIEYNQEKIEEFSPKTLSIMEFSKDMDYILCQKIRSGKNFFGELGYVLRREFNLTDDKEILKTKRDDDDILVFEGKMIHQFCSAFNTPRYFINCKVGYDNLLGKEIKRIKSLYKDIADVIDIEKNFHSSKFLLDYQTYRFGYRVIASSTNERTLISTILPKNKFSVYSIFYLVNHYYEEKNGQILQRKLGSDDSVFIMSIFNSLTLNYYIRNKISANLTMNFIYELPIASSDTEIRRRIIELGFNLLYKKSNPEDYEDLRTELALKIDERNDLALIRAELEVIVAKKLYGLEKSEWEYITQTFIYGSESDTKAELDEIVRFSIELWDNIN